METIDLTLVPILVALVEGAKRVGLPTRWLPLLAIILGIGINVFFSVIGESYTQQIFFGLLAGLGSSGLYDFGKVTALGK